MPTLRQKYKEIYWAWKSMKQRTQNPKCSAYHNYGARGITVCDEWQKFEPFCEWALKAGWQKGLDIDRIDNNMGYSAENCRWCTRQANLSNRRATIFLTVNGDTLPLYKWEEKSGIPRGTLKIWNETKGKEYAERRIEQALKNGYTSKDYGNNRKSVRHIDSGKVFRSVREAANHFNMSSGTLSHYINHKGGKTGKGRFEWEELM